MTSLWTIARAEGPRAAWARLLDRAADRRRAAAYLEVSLATLRDAARDRVAVLHLVGSPLRRSGGGVELQFLARFAVEEAVEPAVACLSPSPRGWVLEASVAGRRLRHTFGVAAPPGLALSAALRAATETLAPRGLHVENATGLPLAALAEAGLPALLSLHDLGLFCPRPHREPATPDGGCGWTMARGCDRCGPAAATAAEVAAVLARAVGLVVPSAWLAREIQARTAPTALPTIHVVPPAIAMRLGVAPPRAPETPRHLAFVGTVLPHKGAALLLELAPALRRRGCRVSAYGGGDPALLAALRGAGVRTTGYYRAAALPARLRRDAVDLALLLSLWPESHGLTLDACLLAGVPALAFDRGALGDRLRAGGGVLVDPAAGAAGVLEALERWRRPSQATTSPSTPEEADTHLRRIYAALGWRSTAFGPEPASPA